MSNKKKIIISIIAGLVVSLAVMIGVFAITSGGEEVTGTGNATAIPQETATVTELPKESETTTGSPTGQPKEPTSPTATSMSESTSAPTQTALDSTEAPLGVNPTETQENIEKNPNTTKPGVTNKPASTTANSTKAPAKTPSKAPTKQPATNSVQTPTTAPTKPTKPTVSADVIYLTIDASVIGNGNYLSKKQVELKKGETAAATVVRGLNDAGFGYRNTGDISNNFYISKITKPNLVKSPTVSKRILDILDDNGIRLKLTKYDSGSLGEFDFTNYSGWRYSVNGNFAGVGMSDYELKAGDNVVLRYTLCLGYDS